MCLAGVFMVLLLTESFFALFLHLETPNTVVFDEVHYGTLCNLYHRGLFHLDAEPPGAKIFMQYFLPQHSSKNIWSKIGKEFPRDFAVWKARLPSTVFGLLLPLLSYNIIRVLKFSKFAAIISTFLIVFDNALTVQSKLFIPDSFTLFLQCLSLYFSLFSSRLVMVLAGIVTGLALSVSTSSIVSWIIVSCIMLNKWWSIVTDGSIPLKSVFNASCFLLICILFIPITVYILIFYLHFALLPLPGPHHSRLSPAFQATFAHNENIASKDVAYGRYITLRSASKGCYLSTTGGDDDVRVGSEHQMITCTPYKASHNWWIATYPHRGSIDKSNKLFNGDRLWIVHSQTQNKLQATDNAAPLTLYKHEVSCPSPNTEMPIKPLWTVQLNNAGNDKNWRSVYQKVQLHHDATGTLLSVTEKKFKSGDFEVVCDSDHSSWAYDDAKWIVEEVFDENFPTEVNEGESVRFGFWDKLIEDHVLMFDMSHSSSEHRHSSSPYLWPFAQTTIAYWHNRSSGAQIHLIGNPVSWCAGITLAVIYGCLLIMWALGMQRQVIKVDQDMWSKNLFASTVLSGGWLLHMAWCASCNHSLFLYSYLPALVYIHMLQACAVETIFHVCGKSVVVIYSLTLLGTVHAYISLSAVSFGAKALDKHDLELLRWWDDWEFQ